MRANVQVRVDQRCPASSLHPALRDALYQRMVDLQHDHDGQDEQESHAPLPGLLPRGGNSHATAAPERDASRRQGVACGDRHVLPRIAAPARASGDRALPDHGAAARREFRVDGAGPRRLGSPFERWERLAFIFSA